MFKFLIYKIGQFIVSKLPIASAYRFAIFFSDLQYYLSPRDRQAVKSNLKAILNTEEDVSAMAKEVFRNFGKYLVEFFRMANEIDQNYIKEKVRVDDIANLNKALDRGRGVIILTAHIGNWELGGVILSMLGYPPTAIALPHRERPVNNLFNQQRESRGVTVIPSNLAVRKSISTLKENKLVAVVADRVFGSHGEVISFMGRKTLIPKGAAIFSVKTGAAIVPVFSIREKDNSFTLHIQEPIFPPEHKVGEEQIEKDVLLPIMQKHTRIIEDIIRKYPTQWLMFRRFGV